VLAFAQSFAEAPVKSILLLLLLAPIPLLAQSRQSIAIDQKASSLTWTGHAQVGTYAPSGNLSIREGKIQLENGNLLGATLLVDMNSMTQSNTDLLHHLKSADFFDVEHYPTALIKIDRIANGTVFGSITIKGKSAPLEAPVKVSEVDGRFTITGKVTLDRTRYGIVYNSPSFFSSLGNKAIRNTFEVEFTLTGPGEIPGKYRL
jgi:polyisoprenoid-binding protein YceI